MSRRIIKYSAIAASLVLTAMMAGCGTTNKEGNTTAADVAKVSESMCAQCHGTSVDHIAGNTIYTDYVASAHYTNNVSTVGCQDCHGGGSQHNGVGPLPYPNPDTAGKCFDCHKPKFLGTVEGGGVSTAVLQAHFYNITGAGVHPAMYVAKNYEKSCTSCHDPHKANNGVGQEHTDWAASKHGKVDEPAWSDEDFKANKDCIRCHTATGFINYVNSSFTLPTTTWATTGDNGREVLTCKACHTDYNFKNRVRTVSAYTAPYNSGASPKTFPDATTSNLCIPCHAGRESGDTVKAVTNFTNVSFKNSHYLPAAGFMYMTVGFTSFTSATASAGSNYTYGDTYTMYYGSGSTPAGQVSSTHRKLGTSYIVGDHGIAAGNLDSNGPCVVCHLKGNVTRATSHTLSATSADAYNQVCFNCHTFETGTVVNAANFVAAFVDPNKEAFTNSLTLAATFLQNNLKIKYDPNSYPYFYDLNLDPGGTKAVKDWTRGTSNQAYGKKVMGACFNINVLTKDPGAFAHGRTYARRLVYDTLDFLDDGIMNLSVGTTAPIESARAGSPVFGLFGKGAAAFTGGQSVSPGSPLAAGSTEGMAYLLNWDRNTGAWKAPERP